MSNTLDMIVTVLTASAYWRWTRWLWQPNAARYALVDGKNGRAVFAPLSQLQPPSRLAAPTAATPSAASTASLPSSSPSVRRFAVTIHGYLGIPRPWIFWRLPLTAAGYTMVDYAYDSGGTMAEISSGLIALLDDTIRAHRAEGRTLVFSFVTHSMGGLALRDAFNSSDFPIPIVGTPSAERAAVDANDLRIDRVVMIATPNQGVAYARTIAKFPLLKKIVLGFARMRVPGGAWIRGITHMSQPHHDLSSRDAEQRACGDVLMTHSQAWFQTHMPLPRCLYPRTLVIAGTMHLLRGLTPQTSDGTVAFAETKLPEPIPSADEPSESAGNDSSLTPLSSSIVSVGPAGSQHMSFHAQHSLLLMHPGVIAATIQFLRTGRVEWPFRSQAS